MKRLFFLGTLLLALALAAGAAWLVPGRGSGSAGDYTLASVEHGRLAEVVSASGVVQPRQVYTVGTQLAGKVVAVLADFNGEMREGEVLLRLDDQPARERLRQAELAVEAARVGIKQAEAARDSARTAARREKARSPEVRRQADVDLVEGQARSAEVGVEAARVKLREAEEALRQAERVLRQTVVRAPTLGGSQSLVAAGGESLPHRPRTFTVLERRVSVNQQIGPPASAQLFTLAGDLSSMQVEARVAEADIHKVRRGLEANFTLPGGDDSLTFRGTVSEVRLAPSRERGAIYYKVILDTRNRRDPTTQEWLLRPGLTASVDLLVRAHDPAWKLPVAALNFRPEEGTLGPTARARQQKGPDSPQRDQWRTVWTVGPDGKPWPLFVRLGGANDRGEPGVQDPQFNEVLAWDPDLRPRPDPKDPSTFPRLIIGATPKKGGLFSPPNIKF
jgi:HlyD family secretion protein